MSIKKWMTKEVISVPPSIKVYAASKLMKQHDIHRLPVISEDKLVGLVTEGTIKEASPSKATSLSVYEMNYLLNKTEVADMMVKDVLTISPKAILEEAVFIMRKNNIGVLPVMSGEELVGIITDKDIFDAFLKISSYGEPGLRVSIALHTDRPGFLADITNFLAQNEINIATVMLDREREGYIIVQYQLLTIDESIIDKLKAANYDVINAVLTK
ncbi:MAG: CBS and ACT domain-containing protein [Streptococcaceae bacterium]|jgi:acetoin utilization protein AcuB|nr:CBS and ACT domain-containing protein [Streptococcaceae bacterium]